MTRPAHSSVAIGAEPVARADPSLHRLLAPRSIVVVGASPDLSKLPGRPLAYLERFGFSGPVYAVNPKYDRIGP